MSQHKCKHRDDSVISCLNTNGKYGFKIKTPGVWKVTNNLKYHGDGYAIFIHCSNVTLDFQNYVLDLGFEGNNAILLKPGISQINIINGCIENTGPVPVPVLDWNVGKAVSFPTGLPVEWDLQQGTQSINEFFRVGNFYGGQIPKAYDSNAAGVDGPPESNSYFPNTEFIGPVKSTGISVSGTQYVNIENMKFNENYVCIEATDSPVKFLTVKKCSARQFGRQIPNIPNVVNKLPYLYSEDVDFNVVTPVVYFGAFLNMITKAGAQYSTEQLAPPHENITVEDNDLMSDQAGHVMYVNPGRCITFRRNVTRLPANHDGWERNENWAVTFTGVKNFQFNDNVFYNGIHFFSPWGAASGHCENNRHIDSYEQGSLPKVCLDIVFRNNYVTFHTDQKKQPAGSSLTFVGNDPVTGMTHIGLLDPNDENSFVYGSSGQNSANNTVRPVELSTPGGVKYSNLITWYQKTADVLNPWKVIQDTNGSLPTSVYGVVTNNLGKRVYGCYDHNDGFMFFQCKYCLIEGNVVSGFRQENTSSVGFEFLNDKASGDNIVRNNTAHGNKAGFRILYNGTAGGTIPTGSIRDNTGKVIGPDFGKGNQNPGQPAGLTPPSSVRFQFYDNVAYNNGWDVNGIYYKADFIGLHNDKINPQIGC